MLIRIEHTRGIDLIKGEYTTVRVTAHCSVVSLLSVVGLTPYLAGSVPWCGWLTKLNLVRKEGW